MIKHLLISLKCWFPFKSIVWFIILGTFPASPCHLWPLAHSRGVVVSLIWDARAPLTQCLKSQPLNLPSIKSLIGIPSSPSPPLVRFSPLNFLNPVTFKIDLIDWFYNLFTYWGLLEGRAQVSQKFNGCPNEWKLFLWLTSSFKNFYWFNGINHRQNKVRVFVELIV